MSVSLMHCLAFSITSIVFFAATNPIERQYLIDKVSFEEKLEGLILEDATPLRRLSLVWDALDQYGQLISGIERQRITWVKRKAESAAGRSEHDKRPIDGVLEALDQYGSIQTSSVTDLSNLGYSHLPQRPIIWWTLSRASSLMSRQPRRFEPTKSIPRGR